MVFLFNLCIALLSAPLAEPSSTLDPSPTGEEIPEADPKDSESEDPVPKDSESEDPVPKDSESEESDQKDAAPKKEIEEEAAVPENPASKKEPTALEKSGESSGLPGEPPSTEKTAESQESERTQEDLEKYWSQLGDAELLIRIQDLQLSGKYDSAQDQLDFLVDRSPLPQHRYHWARNQELMEVYDLALSEYDQLLSEEIDANLTLDLRYRRGIVLDDTGRHREARKDFKKLRKSSLLKNNDREQIDLLIGASLVHSGWRWCGLRKLNRALKHFEGSMEASWEQSRGRAVLVKVLIESADKVSIKPGAEMPLSIRERMDLMKSVEAQIAAIFQLEEPEYTLNTLVLLVDAYLRFYDDVVTAPPAPHFSPFERDVYEGRIVEEAEILRHRARRYANKGLAYADKLGWKGKSRDALYVRRQAIDEERKKP